LPFMDTIPSLQLWKPTYKVVHVYEIIAIFHKIVCDLQMYILSGLWSLPLPYSQCPGQEWVELYYTPSFLHAVVHYFCPPQRIKSTNSKESTNLVTRLRVLQSCSANSFRGTPITWTSKFVISSMLVLLTAEHHAV
jgi:hypothetical protein